MNCPPWQELANTQKEMQYRTNLYLQKPIEYVWGIYFMSIRLRKIEHTV